VLEQPTGDVRIEGWDKHEIEVSISDERELFNVVVEGTQVMVRNVAVKPPDVGGFFESFGSEFGDIGEGLGRAAARVERQVARKMRKIERGMKGIHLDLGRWSGGRDYTIRVPHNCDVSLRTSSGDLTVLSVTGTHFVQSSSGDINLNEVDGTILVSSASGDINLNQAKGKLGARTASGDISVREGRLHELSVSTASGDLNLDLLMQPEREFELKSVSGDVNVKLPHDARLSIEANTLSGDIHTRFRGEINIERRRPGKTGRLNLNGGGLRGRIHTISGDIMVSPTRNGDNGEGSDQGQGTVDLSRASHEHDDITEPETKRARREAEVDILQSLERGDINVEEAMKRLSQL
jgi:hypothetical protein